MATPKLSVSRIVNVSVSLTPQGAQAQNLTTMLLLSTSTIIDTVERFREYTSISQVALDFSTGSRTYKAANLYFSQAPKPARLMIGRWARSAIAGGMRCAQLSTSNQELSAWTSVTSGGFIITVDGGSPQTVSGLNFSTDLTFDAIAARISTAVTGASCLYNANYKRFEFLSDTTGGSSSVSFVSDAPSGTNIADNLNGRSTDPAAYTYPGQSSESSRTVATFFDAYYGQRWYALSTAAETDESDANRLQFAEVVEAMTNKHLYFCTSEDATILVPNTTTDIASTLKGLGYTRTCLMYSSTEPFAAVTMAAKMLAVDYNASNSVLTAKFKAAPGVTAELLNETQATSLADKNCNVFAAYDNDTNIIQEGVVSNGEFVDVITNTDALAVDLQTGVYNRLYTALKKIPQTDAGMHILTTTCEDVCLKYVNNGALAPGQWNAEGFGNLSDGDYLSTGYYVYAMRMDQQLQADRAARHAPPIQVAAKLAGAIHDSAIHVSVNQ